MESFVLGTIVAGELEDILDGLRNALLSVDRDVQRGGSRGSRVMSCTGGNRLLYLKIVSGINQKHHLVVQVALVGGGADATG